MKILWRILYLYIFLNSDELDNFLDKYDLRKLNLESFDKDDRYEHPHSILSLPKGH